MGRWWFVSFVLTGCGPLVGSPAGEVDTSPETSGSVGSSSSGASPSSSTTGPGVPQPGSSGEAGDVADVDGGVAEDAGVPPDLPPEPKPTLCDGDPYALDPRYTDLYQTCIRGLVSFAVRETQSGLECDAHAQFFTVEVAADIEWEEEVLDAYDGTLDDCRLVRHSNSGYGEAEVVVWEDAGDVTFVVAGIEQLGAESGDPMSVLSYDGAYDAGVTATLDAAGFFASGDTTAPLNMLGLVQLPEPIDLLAPVLDGRPIPHDALSVEWMPSSLGVPLDIVLDVNAPGWDFELFCRTHDDGQFTIPAVLTAQLPLPTDASLRLGRSDVGLVPAEDGRFVLLGATSSRHETIALQ